MEKLLSKNWFCCALIGLFTLLLWGKTARYNFVWDDQIYIAQNMSIRSLANVPKFFYSRDAQSAERPSISYRPLRNTVYAVLNVLGGHDAPQPWIFHIANVFWHATVAILLFLVALLLFERSAGQVPLLARTAAAAIAFCFAAHPVASEVVCWAKSMDDLMAAAFVLASARSLLKWNQGWGGYVASLTWYFLAVFSKESAVPFALVVPFLLYGFHRLPRWRSLNLALPFLAVAFVFAACQHLVIGRTSQCPPLSGSYGQTLVDMFPVGAEYLRLLLGIPPFCADYNFMVGAPAHSFFSVPVLGGVVLLVFFCVLTAWLWHRPRWRISSFGLIWAALFLLPVSNLIPMMQYMAERFLYLPLVGFLLALGGVFLSFPQLRVALAGAAVGLVVIWSATSLTRMSVWRDELSLYLSTELEHPGIKRVELNAVSAVLRLPQIEAGRAATALSPKEAAPMIQTLEKARQIYPNNDVLTTQLGIIQMKVGRLKESVALLKLAVQQNPNSAERWLNLARIQRIAGQPAKALDACSQALLLDPQDKDALRLQSELETDLKTAPTATPPAGK